MKLGMNLFLWTGHLGSEHLPLLEELANTGFTLIELPCSDYSATEIRQINTQLDGLGLSRTVATILDEHCNPISSNPHIRQAALDKLRADIDLCALLGAEALIGPMHSAHKEFSGSGPSPQEFEWCTEFLQKAGEYAATFNIELCVEFLNRFECYFLNNCQQARELIEKVDLDNVGVLFDTHHAQIEEQQQAAAIADNIAAINHIHISESHRGTPGTGTVDWTSIFTALRTSNYDGRVVIEAFGTRDKDIANAVNIWRNCFASEEEVYREGFKLIAEGFSAHP